MNLFPPKSKSEPRMSQQVVSRFYVHWIMQLSRNRYDYILLNFISHSTFISFVTAGHSSESKNVAMWDTLLPQKKSLIACKF